jgi:hypothetical protein
MRGRYERLPSFSETRIRRRHTIEACANSGGELPPAQTQAAGWLALRYGCPRCSPVNDRQIVEFESRRDSTTVKNAREMVQTNKSQVSSRLNHPAGYLSAGATSCFSIAGILLACHARARSERLAYVSLEGESPFAVPATRSAPWRDGREPPISRHCLHITRACGFAKQNERE